MKRLLRASVATVLAAGAAVALAVSGARAASTPGWRFVAVYQQVSEMYAASASGPTNAWGVGQTSGSMTLSGSAFGGAILKYGP